MATTIRTTLRTTLRTTTMTMMPLALRLARRVAPATPFSTAAGSAFVDAADAAAYTDAWKDAASDSDASSAAGQAARSTNWLEHNCGDVPTTPRAFDDDVSEMLRGGHAIQIATRALLDAKLSSGSRSGATAYDADHLDQLHLEQRAVERIERAVTNDSVRFRPSLLLPLVSGSSTAVGIALTLFGERVSSSYVTGVKLAISDYYNDQIRELYAHKQHEVALKDLFKTTRDEELEYVDAHAPEALDASHERADADAIRTFAKASSKALLQVAKTV